MKPVATKEDNIRLHDKDLLLRAKPVTTYTDISDSTPPRPLRPQTTAQVSKSSNPALQNQHCPSRRQVASQSSQSTNSVTSTCFPSRATSGQVVDQLGAAATQLRTASDKLQSTTGALRAGASAGSAETRHNQPPNCSCTAPSSNIKEPNPDEIGEGQSRFTATGGLQRYGAADHFVLDLLSQDIFARHISALVQSTIEAERTRIAREIHDDFGQSIVALQWSFHDFADWIDRQWTNHPQWTNQYPLNNHPCSEGASPLADVPRDQQPRRGANCELASRETASDGEKRSEEQHLSEERHLCEGRHLCEEQHVRKYPRQELRQRVHCFANSLIELHEALRRIATTLRPLILEDLGLLAALEWQAEQFAHTTGIACEFNVSLLPDREPSHDRKINVGDSWEDSVESEVASYQPIPGLSDQQATTLFRIVQEALSNVAQHAQATRVGIKFWNEDSGFYLQISDNGKGMTTQDSGSKEYPRTSYGGVTTSRGNRFRPSMGLRGMRERALAQGGEFQIDSRPGNGTTFSIWLPLAEY